MKTLLMIVAAVVVAGVPVQSQQTKAVLPPMRIGVYGGYGFTMHSASFSELPGVPSCCPRFESGSGAGMSFGAVLNLPFASRLSLDLRAGLWRQDGLLSAEEETGVIVNGAARSGAFEHTIDAALTVAGLEPSVSWQVAGGLRLRAGVAAGMLVGATYEQKEQIVRPERTATFVDENGNDTYSRTRNESSGELPGAASFQAAVLAGVGYDLPLSASRALVATPELTYTIPVTSVLAEEQWTVQTVRLGVALTYAPGMPDPQPEPPAPIRVDTLRMPVARIDDVRFAYGSAVERFDTLTVRGKRQIRRSVVRMDTLFVLADPAGPSAALRAVAMQPDGTSNEVAEVGIATRFVSEALPLVSCVFFDSGAADLPERYIRRTDAGETIVHEERNDPVLLHRDVLNVVGERMRRMPETSLTLTGTADPTTEQGRCDLAARRAAVVKDYLVDSWNIAPNRIRIAQGTSCAPQFRTESPNEDGYTENRRVELAASDARILESVWCRRTTEATGITPPVIEYDPDGSTRDGIRSWTLAVYQGDRLLFADSGTGAPAVVRQELTMRDADALLHGMDINARLRLADSAGRTAEVVRAMPVVRDTADIEVHRMSLVLFDISQNVVREEAKIEIMSFLAGLGAGDEVTVTGYTDILGADEYNRVLSERRAQTVCELIRQLVPRANLVQCVGVATTRFPAHVSSYRTPEERFLSRTVQIEIRRQIDPLY